MTKEEAYEKLELPVGTDLHIVRQKFQQMHNEFQVQIDGAFREDMRQKLQTRLMELEEAYKLLIGSEKMDDSGSLPHTEQTFEQKRTEEAKAHTTQLTIQQALSLFGLKEHQDVNQIEQHIALHIANLEQHLSATPLQTAKDAYKIEIEKAVSAKVLVHDWLQKQEEERKRLESEEKQQALSPSARQAGSAVRPKEASVKSKSGLYIGIAVILITIVVVGFYLSNPRGGSANLLADLRQDSSVWEAALTGNSEATYQHYLKQYPEGIFAQAAKDSLMRNELAATGQLTLDSISSTGTDVPVVDKNWRKKYTKVEEFYNKFAVVGINGKYGMVNTSGQEVIPVIYDNIDGFFYGPNKSSWALVEQNGKYGYLDKKGNVVIPIKYGWDPTGLNGEISDGHMRVVSPEGKWGFVNTSGKEVVPLKYDEANWFCEGIAFVRIDKKWGAVDKKGNEVVPFKYDQVDQFGQGLSAVKRDGKWGYVDKNGLETIPMKYDYAWLFDKSGYAVVRLGDRYGTIDKNGSAIAPCTYDDIDREMYHGLIHAKKDNKHGFINLKGEVMIPFQYNYAQSFQTGRSRVTLNGVSYFIDTTGKCVKDCPG